MKRAKHVIRLILIFSVVYIAGATIVAWQNVGSINYISSNLVEGDSVTFGSSLVNLASIKGSTRSHSYDGKRFELEYKNGKFTVSNLHPARVQSQNQIAASYVTGSMHYNFDTLTIYLNSLYQNLYVVTLDSTKPIDVLTGQCTLTAVSKDLNDKAGEIFLSAVSIRKGDWTIYSLPEEVDSKELWKKEHPENTIAKFDLLQIENNGVKKLYNRTDLVLIGADALTLNSL